jgi:hypothetical protein
MRIEDDKLRFAILRSACPPDLSEFLRSCATRRCCRIISGRLPFVKNSRSLAGRCLKERTVFS